MKTESSTMLNREIERPAGINLSSPYAYPYKASGLFEIREKRRRGKAGIMVITSYPPRECGIANYSIDLINAIEQQYAQTFDISICALENGNHQHEYPVKVKHILNTEDKAQYPALAASLNANPDITMVLIQHEFGFFHQKETEFLNFLNSLQKEIVLVFHTVLPGPNPQLKNKVVQMLNRVEGIIVMTQHAANLLVSDYGADKNKISVIAHGTHLVPHLDRKLLKEKYQFRGRTIMSTFGLISRGKSIETSLKALPKIIEENPDILFLIIGKTHPAILLSEGEAYRNQLEEMVQVLKLEKNVLFINEYLPSEQLLEYLQMTDIYLFTSKDPNQAVSGTFSYAISSGCTVISTPIPHALEVIGKDAGIIIDFENSEQLADAVIHLLRNQETTDALRMNGLHKINATSWQNSAIQHVELFDRITKQQLKPEYAIPPINLKHLHSMTTATGIIQFSKLNNPDLQSGYTLDDNARALIAMCMNYENSRSRQDLRYIQIYLNLIETFQLNGGDFLNYMDEDGNFTHQNEITNLSDSNGRAIWALGYLCSLHLILPGVFIQQAENILEAALESIEKMRSTRAMAFSIKGLYYANLYKKTKEKSALIILLANRLYKMYQHESERHWNWFESYLTYANSTLSEAMLLAYLDSGENEFKQTALESFDFLCSQTFKNEEIKVVSNQGWRQKGKNSHSYGEQPIDVAYTILALNQFYKTIKNPDYLLKMKIAYSWFLGKNHLQQIIYNPCTGGCFDGLEENNVNLNQGAESTISHLLSRLTLENFRERTLLN
jgi:glycosyltransferase involved in cell wall biosynthesis